MPDPAMDGGVRAMRPSDATWTARRHVRDLPHGLFPRLGHRFVRHWHAAHIDSPAGVALLAERDGHPVGFLVGSIDHAQHVAWLLEHHRRRLLLLGALALLRRPAVLTHFARTRARRYARRLVRRGGTRGPVPVRPGGTTSRDAVAVIEAIVVDRQLRQDGVGRALVAAFLEQAAGAGVRRAELVTKCSPDGASGFYASLGWTAAGEHTDHDGEPVRRFRVDPVARAGDSRRAVVGLTGAERACEAHG